MKNGKIGVTTENIFPVIKKFLYSDHEIFLRELISNAVDATQKLKTLSSIGEMKGELGDLTIHVAVDKEAKTLTVTDRGVGMTAEEVDKYINQIAFSGAEEFMEKYKNQAIIWASTRRSWWPTRSRSSPNPIRKRPRPCIGAAPARPNSKWRRPMRSMTAARRSSCIFRRIRWSTPKVRRSRSCCANTAGSCPCPSPSARSRSGRTASTSIPTRTTSSTTSFHLTGILYFPKIHNNFEIQKNKIQLYSNQVYVTDQVEGIVPEYLTLLHGVIDSPDIPLNVSRSYLQSDSNVKKISSYITRKVADRLQELFNTMRADYEAKWDDLKIFIEYGILTDEKFSEKAQEFMLWKNIEGKYFTPAEYLEKVKENQTDKNKTVVFLYVDDPVEKHTFLEAAKAKGYDVLLMDGQLDNHYINWYESKNKETRFVRVDSDVIDKLIQKEENIKMSLTEAQQELLRPVFESQMPKDDKIHYNISFEAMSPDEAPVVITQNEFMRRMKEMAAMGGGGGMSQFYGQMPDNFTIAVNGNHPIVADILSDAEKAYGDKLKSITKKIDAAVAEENRFDEVVKGKKEEELTPEEKSTREELSKKIVTLRDERNERLREIGGENRLVKQIIDLALLTNGMLKGKNLTDFIQRSISLIEK